MNLLDLGQIFMGSYNNAQQQARSKWEMDRVNRMDKLAEKQATNAAEQNKLRFEAIKAARDGDTSQLMMIDPDLAMKFDVNLRSQAADGEKTAATLQRQMATIEDPAARQAAEERAIRLTQSGQMPRVEISGPNSSPESIAALGGQADAVLGPKLKEKLPTDLEEFSRLYPQLRPGTPNFANAFRAYQLDMRRAGASQVNIDGKPLPVSAVDESADAETAIETVNDLFDSFIANVPKDGVVDQITARGAALVPNTDAAGFNKERGVAAQVVGTYLEGGKLAEGDYSRYQSFMPEPGDSVQTAERKKATIIRMISKRANRRDTARTDAGFNTGKGPKKTPAKTVQDIVNEVASAPDAFRAQLEKDAAAGDPEAIQILSTMPKARQ